MTFITHGFRVSVISDVRERVRDLIKTKKNTKWDKQQEISNSLTVLIICYCQRALYGVTCVLLTNMASHTDAYIFFLYIVSTFSGTHFILPLKYNITNIRCDCGQKTRTFSLGTVGVGKYNTSMQFKVPWENILVYWPYSQTLLHSVVSTHSIDIFELCHSHWALYKTFNL
jgi:hypothetical protein